MKKTIAIIISVLLLVGASIGLVACKKEKPTTSLTNWGAVKSIGGAIAETENYLYYINGMGSSTDDNAFGTPVKGALMVADKSTIGTENVKTEIVVPKLMVASDYNAGVYLFGEYVYYATPSTSKDSSGNVAKSSLSFCRTKLDGSGTEEFFTVNGIGTSYRMAEKDGEVYVVYYDEEATELVSYNTAKREKIVIAKTDAETTEASDLPNGTRVYLTLSTFRLGGNGDKTQAVFTMTAYAENYFPEKAEDEGEEYVRATESFNVMYAYSVGDGKDANGIYGKMINCGEADDLTYEFTLVEDGYLFYTAKDIVNKTKTYALSLNDIEAEAKYVRNADYVQANIIIENLSEVYYNDSEKSVVYKTSLIDDDAKIKTTIIPGGKVSSLLFVHDGYVYYFATSAKIARYSLGANPVEELVSDDVASSTWYAPQIFGINEVDYLFYMDTSTVGSSYIEYVNISNEAVLVEGEHDHEGEHEGHEHEDIYKLEGQTFIGQMLSKDAANKAIATIEAIPSKDLEYEVDDNGVLSFTALSEAKAEIAKLSKESKENISDALNDKIARVETAQTLARYYYALKDYKNYKDMTDAGKEDFRKAYEEAKAYRQELIDAKDSQYIQIRDMLTEDLKAFYQEAKNIIEGK